MSRSLLWILAAAAWPLAGAGYAQDPARSPTYESDIRPIFRAHCFDCHGADAELKGGLDLRLVRFMTKGGDNGPAIVPGKPGESYLLDRLHGGEMPPNSTVPPDQIATIENWIAAGAPTARPEPESIPPGLGITPEERSFWSFQPIRRPEVPELTTFPAAARVRTPVDALVLAAMPEGLSFSPDADRLTIVRRIYFDLIGLPPTPEELQKWLAEPGEDWYQRLVAELLDSPHYGEHWARHWLDVAGYADSDGQTVADVVRPWAWKYRDWVIRALNADKPIDRFIVEQLAGDELAGPISSELTAEQIELLTATGFLQTAADGTGSGDNSPEARNKVMADTLKIIGTSLLGLSIQCAQCHDHRYDPIPQVDYYALRAVFEPALDWQNWRTPAERLVSLATPTEKQKAAEIEAEAHKIANERIARQDQFINEQLEKQLLRVADETLREPLRTAYRLPAAERTPEQTALLAAYPFVRELTPGSLYLYDPKAAEELKKFDERIAQVRASKPAEEFLRVVLEPANHLPETKLFHRGDHQQPKQTVLPGALAVAAPDDQYVQFAVDDESLPTTGRRLALARWLTSPENPLVARVLVNRVWMHHFGRGIVTTPSDFGKLGTPPTHPELLDWLAAEFVQQGWSLKHLHRVILSSTVWRQSSHTSAELPAADPANTSYWRKPIVRLEAEAIRDRMLAASGQLDRTVFGPPLAVQEDDTGQVVVQGEQKRRSLYIQARRTQPVAMLQAFDAPVMETNCECRPVSTAATQSLMLMNGEFILQQAARLAQRASGEAVAIEPSDLATLPSMSGPRDPGAIWGATIRAWELALSRRPTTAELQLTGAFLAQQLAYLDTHPERLPAETSPELQALTSLCQTLLSSNEFLYVD